MRVLERVILLSGLLAAAAGCQLRTPPPTPTPAVLSLSISGGAQPLMERLVAGFRAEYPSVVVLVETGSAAAQVQAVREGRAALGALALPLGDDPPGPAAGLWRAPIAVDEIAVVVNVENPIRDLTMYQLKEVFGGRIWHWSDLEADLSEDEIAVASREEGSSARALFESVVMARGRVLPGFCPAAVALGGEPDLLAACTVDPVTSTAVIMIGDEAVVAYVAAHPGAIGYVSAGALALSASADQVRAVALEGALPDPQHAAEGRYPLTQPLYLVASGAPAGPGRLLVDYCLGREGQSIAAAHYAPVRPSTR